MKTNELLNISWYSPRSLAQLLCLMIVPSVKKKRPQYKSRVCPEVPIFLGTDGTEGTFLLPGLPAPGHASPDSSGALLPAYPLSWPRSSFRSLPLLGVLSALRLMWPVSAHSSCLSLQVSFLRAAFSGHPNLSRSPDLIL